MQSPEQPAPPVPIPERFKQEIDYKYDGLCTMRYLLRLIFIIAINKFSLAFYSSVLINGLDGWKY